MTDQTLSFYQSRLAVLERLYKLAQDDLLGYQHMKIEHEQHRQEMIKAQNLLNAFADENKELHEFMNETGAWQAFNARQHRKKYGAQEQPPEAMTKEFQRTLLGDI